MLRDDVKALIAERLGNRKNLDNLIISELKLAQSTLETGEFLPWFLLTEMEQTVTNVADYRVGLPLDFLMECEETGLWYEDANGVRHDLEKKDLDQLTATYQTNSGVVTGPPERYALVGNYFYVFPQPDQAYTLKTIYYGMDQTLDTNIENKWLKWCPDLLMAMAGVNVAGFVGNDRAAALFQARISSAEAQLIKQHEARANTNREYSMGWDD